MGLVGFVLYGVFWVSVFGFAVWVWLWSCVFFPSLCSVSYPSMMTWALRPHGVRTRGKKNVGCLIVAFTYDSGHKFFPSCWLYGLL